MVSIRPEEPQDHASVHAINLAAFEGGPEADLVDTLRSSSSIPPLCPTEVASPGIATSSTRRRDGRPPHGNPVCDADFGDE